tara:strand:- start:402887 stop:403771 length:885 start_codon:yes stop_codon:yes gene_type:complete
MKTLIRTILPALLCLVIVPTTCQARWSLFSRCKTRSSCRTVRTCPQICSPPPVACDITPCQAGNANEFTIDPAHQGIVVHGANTFAGDSWSGISPIPMATAGNLPAPVENQVLETGTVDDGIAIAPVADSQPMQLVGEAEDEAKQEIEAAMAKTEEALARAEKAENALKRSRAQAKKASAEATEKLQQVEADMAAAKSASQEQIKKLRAQNAKLKKSLEATRARVEKMQSNAGKEKAKREEEPKPEQANNAEGSKKPGAKKAGNKSPDDKNPGNKKPGNRKPANKKSVDENADA